MSGSEQERVRRSIFSRRGALIAPAIAPLILGLAFGVLAGGNVIAGFLTIFVTTSVLCYAMTVGLALPCLWLLSLVARPTLATTTALGAMLGGLFWLPLTAFEWSTSGIDSGPPSDTLAQFLWDGLGGWEMWLLVVCGAITAAAYWRIAERDLTVAS